MPALLSLLSILTLTLLGTSSAKPKILIYYATERFRHDSIPFAINILEAKQKSINVEFEATQDSSRFRDDILANYDALLFLSTTGEVLDDAGKASFQTYLNRGGNFVGIHSATDTLRNTSAYIREIGSLFDYHADLQQFTVNVIDSSHPSTSMLPLNWVIQDELYNFEFDPRSLGAVVVLAADETSYIDKGPHRFDQGTPHPIAWYQEHGAGVSGGGPAGRSFYTSLGHLNETWQDELFISHVLSGVSWALEANTTRATNSSALVGNAGSGTPSRTSNGGATTQPTQMNHFSSSTVPSNVMWSILGILLIYTLDVI